MLERFRDAQGVVLRPAARRLVQLGVTPNAVTWLGTVLVAAASLICFPAGWLWQGASLVLVFSCADMLDGHMARELTGRDDRWGAFLDSSLDRLADAAILGGLAWHLASDSALGWAAVAVGALVAAQLTSYVKARGEALGCTVERGLVTRPDRLALALLGAFLAGVGVPGALEVAMTVLAVGGGITVGQRLADVRGQLST